MSKSLATVYNNLSVMLEAGVPVLKSLKTVRGGTRGKLSRAFRNIYDHVAQGDSLADSMARHPKVFSIIDVALVEVGEQSGNLSETLKSISQWHDLTARMKKIITSGLYLPIMLIHAVAVIAPLPTLFLGGWDMDQYYRTALFILSLFYVPAIVIFLIIRFTPQQGLLRMLLDAVALRIPLFGKGLWHLAVHRYCRSFHILQNAGVPADKTAQKAYEVTGNAVVGRLFKGGANSVLAGKPVSQGFSRSLPGWFMETWQVGEESGTMDRATDRLANNAADTSERKFIAFARWFPRFIYFLVSLFIIYLIFGGLGLLFGLYSSIQ